MFGEVGEEKLSDLPYCFLCGQEVNMLTFPKHFIDIPLKDEDGSECISVERVCSECFRERMKTGIE